MAVYIDDSGGSAYDALFSGTKGTDYDYNSTNKIVWFSSTGTASTGFTLPNSPWIIYEVYAPDSYTNSLSGGTIVRGHTEYTDTIGTIATTLSTWKTAFDAATGFTTYKVKATHYKGSDLADVYYADEGEGFSLSGGTEDGIADGAFTGYGSTWVLDDSLIASSVTEVIKIAMLKTNPPTEPDSTEVSMPTGVTINPFLTSDASTTAAHSLVNINNTTSSVQIRFDNTWGGTARVYISGDNSEALTDYQMCNSWYQSIASRSISIWLPIGTYTIRATAATGQTETIDYTFNSDTQSVVMTSAPQNAYAQWQITITTAGWNAISIAPNVGTNCRISGIDVTRNI